MKKPAINLLLHRRKQLALAFVFLIFIQATVHAQVAPEPEKGVMAGQPVSPAKPDQNGLLFYLSGEKKFDADYAAGGQVQPNYLRDVKVIPNDAYGAAFEADDKQLMSYWAPGNNMLKEVLCLFSGVPVIRLALHHSLFFVWVMRIIPVGIWFG